MDHKKEIIKRINQIAGKYSAYEVFSDWIRMASLAMANNCCMWHDKIWRDREKLYTDTMARYTKAEQRMFPELTGLLVMAMEENMRDILGEVYMQSGMGSAAAGQFFTPFHLSELTAKLTKPEPDADGYYRIYEPSCGGGGMIIALASAIKSAGEDYQKKMRVVAQDLDWKGVYMCYLQCGILGINALVVQGNTLQMPYQYGMTESHVLRTPRNKGVLI